MSMRKKPTAEEIENAPRAAVSIVGDPVLRGDITLSDGTTLHIILVTPSVGRLEGVTDAAGRPLYEVNSQVVTAVKEWKKA